MAPTLTKISITSLQKIASGKVRDLYEIDSNTLLFVATDRISAYDVIMANGIPQKGVLLTLLSDFWFRLLQSRVPGLRTHFISLDFPPQIAAEDAVQLRNRSMVVRRLKILPLEVIVRGYITGSAWKEYCSSGTVHGLKQPTGLQQSQAFEEPIYTPSTKAEAGEHDENISPDQAVKIVGADCAAKVEALALKLYTTARDYARERGIIIADTKFEFGVDEEGELVLVDEVLTPDSSRFWKADTYQVGKEPVSFDKQFLRDWLTSNKLKGKEMVEMPIEVVEGTSKRYREAFQALTGESWAVATEGA